MLIPGGCREVGVERYWQSTINRGHCQQGVQEGQFIDPTLFFEGRMTTQYASQLNACYFNLAAHLSIYQLNIMKRLTSQNPPEPEVDDRRSILIENRVQEIFKNASQSANTVESNNLRKLFKAYRKHNKHPILQTLPPDVEVFRTNPDRKKKPIEQYLDTVNTIYKKKDLEMLINPINVVSTFQNWAPREVAVFEGAIVRFGNQFEFIAELVQTKSAKQCYQFYWQWKGTSHFRAYKAQQNVNSRSNQTYT